eukprot:COSAG03_NODE_10563_length_643_cov_0.906250_1_plen_23_part_10
MDADGTTDDDGALELSDASPVRD